MIIFFQVKPPSLISTQQNTSPTPRPPPPPYKMAGFESVFQRMDETIVDVCLRQLTWDDLPPSLWQAGSHDIFAKTWQTDC